MSVFYNSGAGATPRLDPEDIRVQKVRDRVLAALDDAAKELYGEGVLGAIDDELPFLFRALDRHAASILERASAREG